MNPTEPQESDEQPENGPSLGALRSFDARISREAWEQAYPILWNAAVRLLRHILTGPEHEHDREDIAAQALSELVRGVIANRLPSFNQMTTFGDVQSMSQQIIRARTKDFFRSRGRHPEDPTDEIPDLPAADVDASPALSWQECEELIRDLPPPQPEIFDLHYARGHTAEEISAKLRMPRGTILSHLFRGKKTLRAKLNERATADRNQPPSP